MARLVSDFSLEVNLKVVPKGEAEHLECRGSYAMIMIMVDGEANTQLLRRCSATGYQHRSYTDSKVLRDVVELGRWYRFKAKVVPV